MRAPPNNQLLRTKPAFRKWRFKPWRLDGVDQEMLAEVTVHYRLMDQCAPPDSRR